MPEFRERRYTSALLDRQAKQRLQLLNVEIGIALLRISIGLKSTQNAAVEPPLEPVGEEFFSPGSVPPIEPMQRRLRAFDSSHSISSLRNFARKVCNDSTDPLGIQCSRRCGCPHLCISHLGPMVLIAGLWLCNSASCPSRRPDMLPAGADHSVPAGQTQSSTTSHRGRVR